MLFSILQTDPPKYQNYQSRSSYLFPLIYDPHYGYCVRYCTSCPAYSPNSYVSLVDIEEQLLIQLRSGGGKKQLLLLLLSTHRLLYQKLTVISILSSNFRLEMR